MSLKVPDGFYLDAATLDEAWRVTDDFRLRMRPLIREAHVQAVARLSAREIDEPLSRGEPAPPAPLSFVTRGRPEPFSDLDFYCAVVLYPPREGDEPDGRIYGSLVVRNTLLRDAWYKTHGVHEFGYTNQVDCAEGISHEQWQERGRIWDGIFRTDDLIDMRGLRIPVSEADQPRPSVENVLAAMPSFEDRLTWASRERAIGERFYALRSDDPAIESFRAISKASRWVDTDEGKAAVAAHAGQLVDVLPREITGADLVGEWYNTRRTVR